MEIFYWMYHANKIDFENNPYNKLLLRHLLRLFVETLLNRKELHSLPYFGKFLLPEKREGKIETVFRKILFGSAEITSILKRVYVKRQIVENRFLHSHF